MTLNQINEILTNGDGVIVSQFTGSIQEEDNPQQSYEKLEKMAVVIIVTKGKADIVIDYKQYSIDTVSNNLVIIGKFNKIGYVRMKKDFEAQFLIISMKFISRLISYRPNDIPSFDMPITNFIAMKDAPVLHLKYDKKKMLLSFLDKVKYNVSRDDALLRLQLLYISVVEFIMETMNEVIPLLKGTTVIKKQGRKMELVQQFSSILIHNYKQEHSVSFYADKLCVSTQYLSKATRNVLGISASRAITDMIMSEALVLLRTPGMSVQQIAQNLGFFDQSAFGNFFKKQTGSSPMNYRKRS